MSRISRLDRSEMTPEMAALYDKVLALRGKPRQRIECGSLA
jgi:hypothetical protein